MAFSNPGWVGYFDRTYDQIKANVLTNFQSLVQEITDHTETNPWVKGISIWSALIEMLGYYVDSSARETFLPTSQEFSSAVKIAKQYDYRVKGAIPASVTLRFTSSVPATGDISIPIGTIAKTGNDEFFATTAAGTILTGQTFVDITAKQWTKVNNVALGNSNGTADQVFVLEEDVADGSVTVLVNAVPYTPVDSFIFSLPTDQHFIAGLQEDTKMRILFGDNISGKIPPSSNPVTATYYVTLGEDGNVGAGKVTTLVSVITVPGSEVITVNNPLQATGGAGFENLSKLKKRIPLSIRTKYRAVTEQDFVDVTELFGGVEKAHAEFDCDIDRYVHVHVVPDGGGPASQQLLDDVTAYLELRKIINTHVLVQSAGIIYLKLTVNVTALPGYSNASVKNDVEQALLDFGDSENQVIGGNVVIGDIYEVIEAVTGVLNSVVSLLTYFAYAMNLTNDNVLNWINVIQSGSVTTTKWLIKFTTNGSYELFRGTDFVGVFAVDVQVVQPEIIFTVNGNHVAGDQYSFYTYPYNQSIFLQEPSIPAIQISDLTINVTGGV